MAQSQNLAEQRLHKAEKRRGKRHLRDAEPVGGLNVFLFLGRIAELVGNFADGLED